MIMCFDIGGTTIKVAQAQSVDAVVPMGRVATPANNYADFVAVLRDAIANASAPPTVAAFSIAGVLDAETGIATVANIPCLNGLHLLTELEEALGVPVVLANDADCFALAEATVGAGRGHDVVFGLILGTGVGGGVVVRGQLINAGGGFAGEMGHGPIAQRVFEGRGDVLPAFGCGCGLTGCLDAVCSARGLEKLHLHLHGTALDSLAIVEGWEGGDATCASTISVWLEILSGPLVVIQNLLGAGIVAVGGGMANSTRLIAVLDEAVRAKTLRRFTRPLVVPADCPNEAGLVGAAILGLQRQAELVP